MVYFIVLIGIYIINMACALYARFKMLRRSYPPERSQIYAIIWTFVALHQFIAAALLYKHSLELNLMLAAIFTTILGITIYFLFRNGYGTDIVARWDDWDNLKNEFNRLSKDINHDIDSVEEHLLFKENTEYEKLRSSIRDLKLFLWKKDAFDFPNGVLFDTVSELLDCYMFCAHKMIYLKGNIPEKSSSYESEYYDTVEIIKNVQESFFKKIEQIYLSNQRA